MAETIFHELRQRLAGVVVAKQPVPATVRIERVRVGETSSSWAEYYEG